jgi:uncharacterized protein (TIGR02271 family)
MLFYNGYIICNLISSVSNKNEGLDWNDVIKKEARGSNDDDLGEVQEVGNTYVLTQKGLISKNKFYLPKYLVEGYDGDVVRFRISEEEAKNSFVRDSAPAGDEYSKYKKSDAPKDIETRIPMMGEKLNVSKTQSTQEAKIIKEPVTEKKTVEVPVTHEEVSVERRPASGSANTTTNERPVTSEEEIRIPLKEERVKVTKEPYVKEEVAVKKPVTETEAITDEVSSERVNVHGASED